jgi:hypothetical protein
MSRRASHFVSIGRPIMAEKKSPAGPADFIAKIVKDPKNPPETLLLTGYLGASSEDGHTRLYFDAGLANYVEIPSDAILNTEPSGDDGLGASYVWIKRDAVLIYGPAGSQRPKGTFLEGPIMQDHLGAAAGAGGGAGQRPNTFWPCTVFQCGPQHADQHMERQAVAGGPRSDFVACTTWTCPPRSDFAPCQSWICPPTPHAHCPPTPPMLCMTVHCTVPPQCPHPTLPPICPLLSAPPHCPYPTVPPMCPHLSVPPHCPTVAPICPHTLPPPCPLLSAPPHCPTVGACPSIACQSAACQPGAAAAAGGHVVLEAMAPAAAPASAICATAIACPTQPAILCGPPSFFGPCLTHQPHCVSVFIPCPTQQLPCPTHHAPCPSVFFPACPTHQPPCPTLFHPCPTHQFHCPSVVTICPVTAVCQAQA